MSKPVPFQTTLEVRDHCLCLQAQRLARQLARLFDDALRPFGLTNQQFSLLMALNRPEPPPLGPVAELLGIDRTTLTAALKPLVRRGFVRIEARPGNTRSRCLHLTTTGEATLAAALPAWRRAHTTLDQHLEHQSSAGLRDTLVVLGRAAIAANGANERQRIPLRRAARTARQPLTGPRPAAKRSSAPRSPRSRLRRG